MESRQLFDWLEQKSDSCEECDQILRVPSGAEDVKQKPAEAKHRDDFDNGVHQFLRLNALHAGVDDFSRCVPETLELLAFETKGFNHPNTRQQFHQLARLADVRLQARACGATSFFPEHH